MAELGQAGPGLSPVAPGLGLRIGPSRLARPGRVGLTVTGRSAPYTLEKGLAGGGEGVYGRAKEEITARSHLSVKHSIPTTSLHHPHGAPRTATPKIGDPLGHLSAVACDLTSVCISHPRVGVVGAQLCVRCRSEDYNARSNLRTNPGPSEKGVV